jgi:hypothetical protein
MVINEASVVDLTAKSLFLANEETKTWLYWVLLYLTSRLKGRDAC